MTDLLPRSVANADELDQNLFQTHANGASLQDSFRKFRDQKKKERHILKLSRNGEFSSNGERTDVYKDALREKFIEAAKKYIGVPYAERYKADDVPIAPLYLDCCALVRRAVTDLQDDFGIILAKWNQAYQMDTLPIVLTESELRPGDLIFYEGLYNSKRSKSQKHNNVHVEIFLGGETGEATIGSRYHKGSVSVFPSYKFTSTTWSLVQYHFRSLDTWLSGECKSHCPEHRWHSDLLGIEAAAGKRSIFNDDSDCESAGGGEVDEENECFCIEIAPTSSLKINDSSQVQSASSSALDIVGVRKKKSLVDSNDISDAENLPLSNDASPVSGSKARKGNPKNKNRIPKCLQERPKSAETGNNSPKSLGSTSSGATIGKRGGVAREGLGLVNGSALSLQKRSLSAPINEVSNGTEVVVESKISAASSGREKTTVPFTYYVGKSNGWRLLKDSLDRRGWQQLPFEYSFSSRFNLKWVERRSQIDYRAHTAGQLVNHIPNNDCISTKVGLLQTLREKYCRVPAGSIVRKATPWLPETYQLDSPADVTALFEVENSLIKAKAESSTVTVTVKSASDQKNGEGSAEWRSKNEKENEKEDENCEEITSESTSISLHSSQGILERCEENSTETAEAGCLWIYKPSCNNRGRGIKVVRGREALELICYGKQTGDPHTSIPPSPGILQRYVENPLLVGAEHLKFDVRCYMLVARNDPYTVYYHPGYCRLSLKRYSASVKSLDDPTIHLTNASVQKKDDLYEMNKELQVLTQFIFSVYVLLFIFLKFILYVILYLKRRPTS